MFACNFHQKCNNWSSQTPEWHKMICLVPLSLNIYKYNNNPYTCINKCWKLYWSPRGNSLIHSHPQSPHIYVSTQCFLLLSRCMFIYFYLHIHTHLYTHPHPTTHPPLCRKFFKQCNQVLKLQCQGWADASSNKIHTCYPNTHTHQHECTCRYTHCNN